MAQQFGKFFGPKDVNFIKSINAELYGDVVQNVVTIFKIAPAETVTNIYGESDSSTGKIFYPGVDSTCMIKKNDIDTDYTDFGPDRKQVISFAFREQTLQSINLFPEIGDIIEYNSRYHEIDNVIREQFLGGIPDKSLSIICKTHYSRLSKLSIVNRQV